MRQYAIDKVEVSWALIDLTEGIAVGTSIVETRNAPTYTKKPTGYGKVVRVRNPDKSGTVTITMDQESATHKKLRAVLAIDDISRNQVFNLVIKDTTSLETFIYTNAFIETDVDESRGTESATFPWVFGFETFQHQIPGNLSANVVDGQTP